VWLARRPRCRWTRWAGSAPRLARTANACMHPELAVLRLMNMGYDGNGHLAHAARCGTGPALPQQKLTRPEMPQSRVPGNGAGKLIEGDLGDRVKRGLAMRYGRSSGGVNIYIRGYL
jgi:hypothetical protein